MKKYIKKKLHCYVKWLHEFFMPFFVLIKTMVVSHSQLQIEMVRLSIVHINLRTLKSAGALTLSNPEGWGYGEAHGTSSVYLLLFYGGFKWWSCKKKQSVRHKRWNTQPVSTLDWLPSLVITKILSKICHSFGTDTVIQQIISSLE